MAKFETLSAALPADECVNFMDHFGERYIPTDAFREEIRRLRNLHRNIADRYLEDLEQTRLVVPKLRIRYPDTIARRCGFHKSAKVE
jgi:hypothetical protein